MNELKLSLLELVSNWEATYKDIEAVDNEIREIESFLCEKKVRKSFTFFCEPGVTLEWRHAAAGKLYKNRIYIVVNPKYDENRMTKKLFHKQHAEVKIAYGKYLIPFVKAFSKDLAKGKIND